MEDDERYAIASVSGTSGALHVWLRSDGSARRMQNGCGAPSPACVSSVVHEEHLYSASSSASGTAARICAHSLSRAGGGPALRSAAPEAQLTAVAVAPELGLVAAGGASGRLYVWSLHSGDMVASWDAHFREVVRLCFTDDEQTLLSAGADASVLAFSVGDVLGAASEEREVQPRVTLHGHDLPLTALAVGFGGASARVLTVSKDRTAKMWHLSSGTCVGTVLLSMGASDAVFAVDESAAYVGLDSGAVVCIEPEKLVAGVAVSDSSLRCIPPPELKDEDVAAVTALAVSPEGYEVVVGYSDGQVRVFDAESHMQLMVYSKHGDVPITSVSVLHPVPDSLLADAGGIALSKDTEDIEDGLDSRMTFSSSVMSAGAPKPLLFEGALRRAVDPEFEEHYLPRVWLPESDAQSHVWKAIEEALKLEGEDNGSVGL